MTTKYMTVYVTKPLTKAVSNEKKKVRGSYYVDLTGKNTNKNTVNTDAMIKNFIAILVIAFVILAYIFVARYLGTKSEPELEAAYEPAISTVSASPLSMMQEKTNFVLLENLIPNFPAQSFKQEVEEEIKALDLTEEIIEVESDEVIVEEEEVISKAEEIGLYDDITFLGYYNVTGYDPYCEHCCGKSDGITASGEVAQYNHTVAMNDLPFGTKIYIPYIGVFYVEDRGGSSVGVDIACNGHDACYAITAANQPVYIINS